MRTVRPVRDDDFVDVVLGAAAPVAVGCEASSSSTPSPLGRLLDDLAREHDWLVVARLDTSRSPRTATAYRVAEGPAVLLFDAGQLIATLAGVPRVDAVTAAFATVVASRATPTDLPSPSTTVSP